MSEFFRLEAPQDAPAEVLKYNGQIMTRFTFIDTDMRIGLGSLRGRQDEGVGIRVPEEWAKPLTTNAEREHAEWLDRTFFEREAYVSEEERAIEAEPWHVERSHAKGSPPAHDTFSVLTPNPDAGKTGVPYSGEHLSVVQCLDDEAHAHLFAAAREFRTASEALLEYDRLSRTEGNEEAAGEALDRALRFARIAISKANERTPEIND
jgi:hypothetical protein